MTPEKIKDKAEQYGREDARNGDAFFPEQLGAGAQVYYTLGFLAEKPGNLAAQAWMQQRMAQREAVCA